MYMYIYMCSLPCQTNNLRSNPLGVLGDLAIHKTLPGEQNGRRFVVWSFGRCWKKRGKHWAGGMNLMYIDNIFNVSGQIHVYENIYKYILLQQEESFAVVVNRLKRSKKLFRGGNWPESCWQKDWGGKGLQYEDSTSITLVRPVHYGTGVALTL